MSDWCTSADIYCATRHSDGNRQMIFICFYHDPVGSVVCFVCLHFHLQLLVFTSRFHFSLSFFHFLSTLFLVRLFIIVNSQVYSSSKFLKFCDFREVLKKYVYVHACIYLL